MLRSTLLLAVFLIPTAASADKLVRPDSDSYVEVESTTSSVLNALNPVSPAQALPAATSGDGVRPSAAAPQMQAPVEYDMSHEFDSHYIDNLMKPDYTAESFRP